MFSSLFGPTTPASGDDGNSDSLSVQPHAQAPPPRSNPPVKPRPGTGGQVDVSGFDPTLLERGVDAMKELTKSGKTDEILSLLNEQEQTKRKAMQLRIEEQRAQRLQMEAEMEKHRQEQQRRTDQNRSELDRSNTDHRQELERQTQQRILEEQRRTNDDWLSQQNEMFMKQQEIQKRNDELKQKRNRETLKYKAQLDQETARVREAARADGKIKLERENADIHLKELKETLLSEKDTKLKLKDKQHGFIQSYTNNLVDTVTDPRKLSMLVGGASAVFLGFYSAKVGTRVIGQYVASRLGKPSLIRETSRLSYRQPFTRMAHSFKSWRMSEQSMSKDLFNGLILRPNLMQKLRWLATATHNTCKHNAPFRNILLHGPPGTGKTLFAKKLALSSGLEYAIMTGGDFAQLGKEAVTELHKVFDWAKHSKKGTLLFIDEADAFLRKGRGDVSSMSEDMRNALSAFLYRTGSPSNKFMIVMATNLPNTLDCAVVDRIDEHIHFALPDAASRAAMFKFYITEHLINIPERSPGVPDADSPELDVLCEKLASLTDGISGRTVSKLAIALRSAMYSGQASSFSSEVAETIIKDTLQKEK